MVRERLADTVNTMIAHLCSAALVLGLLAAGPSGIPSSAQSASALGGPSDSDAVALYAAPAKAASTAVRTRVALPAEWKLKSKGQLKIRTPKRVRCTRSGWKSARVSGRKVYVAVTLQCKAPADGATRTVVLSNAKRKSQRVTLGLGPGASISTPPVTVPGASPAPAPAPAPPPPAPVKDMGRADDYVFTKTQPGNPAVPVTWSHCTPVDVAVNLGPANAAEQDLVATAIARVADASGLPLRYAGPTTYLPTAGTPVPFPDGIEIVFAVAQPGESSYTDGYALGVATMIYTGYDVQWAARGRVVIDWRNTSDFLGEHPTARTGLYMHELGHAVGLGHAAESTQLMYMGIPTTNDASWGSGDRTGLAQLGAQPCPVS